MEDLEKKFNKKFLILINLLVSKNKNNPEILTLRDKFISVKKHTPNQIIQATGPRLWKYREQISEGNAEFFLGKDITEFTEKSEEINETAKELFPKFQKMYSDATESEKALVIKTTKSLLSIYAKYLSIS